MKSDILQKLDREMHLQFGQLGRERFPSSKELVPLVLEDFAVGAMHP